MAPDVLKNLSAIKNLCEQHHVKRLFLFGSAYSGTFTASSDVDFFYEMNHDSFRQNDKLDYATEIFDLETGLENLLRRKVDLIRKDMILEGPLHKIVGDRYQLVYHG